MFHNNNKSLYPTSKIVLYCLVSVIITIILTTIISSTISFANAAVIFSECNSGDGTLVIENKPIVPDTTFSSSLNGCHIIIRNSSSTYPIDFDPLDQVNITIDNLDCTGIGTAHASCLRFTELTNVGNLSITNVFCDPAAPRVFTGETPNIHALIVFAQRVADVNDTFLLENITTSNLDISGSSSTMNVYAVLMQNNARNLTGLDPSNPIFYDETSSNNPQLMKQRLPFPRAIFRNIFLNKIAKVEAGGNIKVYAVAMQDIVDFNSVVFENIAVEVQERLTSVGGGVQGGAMSVQSIHGIGDYLMKNRRSIALANLIEDRTNNNDHSLLYFSQLAFTCPEMLANRRVQLPLVNFGGDKLILGFKDVIVTGIVVRDFRNGLKSDTRDVDLLFFSPEQVFGLASQAATSTNIIQQNNEDLFAKINSRFHFSNFSLIVETPTTTEKAHAIVSNDDRSFTFQVLGIQQSIKFFTSLIIDGITVDGLIIQCPTVAFDIFYIQGLAGNIQQGPAAIALTAAQNSIGHKIPTSSFIMSNINIFNVSVIDGPDVRLDAYTYAFHVYNNMGTLGTVGYENILLTNISVETIAFGLVSSQAIIDIDTELVLLKLFRKIHGGRSVFDESNSISTMSASSVGSFEVSNINVNRVERENHRGEILYCVLQLPDDSHNNGMVNFETVLIDDITFENISTGNTMRTQKAQISIIDIPNGILGVKYDQLFYASQSTFQVSNICVKSVKIYSDRNVATLELFHLRGFSIGGYSSYKFEHFSIEHVSIRSQERADVNFVMLDDGTGLAFPFDYDSAPASYLPILPARSRVIVQNFSLIDLDLEIEPPSSSSFSFVRGFFVGEGAFLKNFDEIRVRSFTFRKVKTLTSVIRHDLFVQMVRLQKETTVGADQLLTGSGRDGSLFSVEHLHLANWQSSGNQPNAIRSDVFFAAQRFGLDKFETIRLSNFTRLGTTLDNILSDVFVSYLINLDAPITALSSFEISHIHDRDFFLSCPASYAHVIIINKQITVGNKFLLNNISFENSRFAKQDISSARVQLLLLNNVDAKINATDPRAEFIITNLRLSNMTVGDSISFSSMNEDGRYSPVIEQSPQLETVNAQLVFFDRHSPNSFVTLLFENLVIDGVSSNSSYTSGGESTIAALRFPPSTEPALESPSTSLRFTPSSFTIRNAVMTNLNIDIGSGSNRFGIAANVFFTVYAPQVTGFTRITFENIELTNSKISNYVEGNEDIINPVSCLVLADMIGPNNIAANPDTIDAPFISIRNIAVTKVSVVYTQGNVQTGLSAIRMTNDANIRQFTSFSIDNVSLVDSSFTQRGIHLTSAILPRVITLAFHTNDNQDEFQGIAIPWMVSAPSTANDFNPRGAALSITNILLARIRLEQSDVVEEIVAEMRAMNLDLEKRTVHGWTTMKFEFFEINDIQFITNAAIMQKGGGSTVSNIFSSARLAAATAGGNNYPTTQIPSIIFNNFKIINSEAKNYDGDGESDIIINLMNVLLSDVDVRPGTTGPIQLFESWTFSNMLVHNCTASELADSRVLTVNGEGVKVMNVRYHGKDDTTAYDYLLAIYVGNLQISSTRVRGDTVFKSCNVAGFWMNKAILSAPIARADGLYSSFVVKNVTIIDNQIAVPGLLLYGIYIDAPIVDFYTASFSQITLENNNITHDPNMWASPNRDMTVIAARVDSVKGPLRDLTNRMQGVTSLLVSNIVINDSLLRVNAGQVGVMTFADFENARELTGFEKNEFEDLVLSGSTVENHATSFVATPSAISLYNVVQPSSSANMSGPLQLPASLMIQKFIIANTSLFKDTPDAAVPGGATATPTTVLNVANFKVGDTVYQFSPCTVKHLSIVGFSVTNQYQFDNAYIQNVEWTAIGGGFIAGFAGAPGVHILHLADWNVQNVYSIIVTETAAVANLISRDRGEIKRFTRILVENFAITNAHLESRKANKAGSQKIRVTAHQFRLETEQDNFGSFIEGKDLGIPGIASSFILQNFMIKNLVLKKAVIDQRNPPGAPNGLENSQNLAVSNFYFDGRRYALSGFGSVTFQNLAVDTLKVAVRSGNFLINNIFFANNDKLISATTRQRSDFDTIFIKIADTTVRSFEVITAESRNDGDSVYVSSLRFGIAASVSPGFFYFSGFYRIIITNVVVEDVNIDFSSSEGNPKTFYVKNIAFDISQSSFYGPGSNLAQLGCSEVVEDTTNKHLISFEISNVIARNIYMFGATQGGWEGIAFTISTTMKGYHKVLYSNISLENFFYESAKRVSFHVIDGRVKHEGCTGNPIPFVADDENNNNNNNNNYIRSSLTIKDIVARNCTLRSLSRGDGNRGTGFISFNQFTGFDDILFSDFLLDDIHFMNGNNGEFISNIIFVSREVTGTNSSRSTLSFSNFRNINSRMTRSIGGGITIFLGNLMLGPGLEALVITSFRKVSFDDFLIRDCEVDATILGTTAVVSNIQRFGKTITGSTLPLFDESNNNNKRQHPPSVFIVTNLKIENFGTGESTIANADTFIVENHGMSSTIDFTEFGMMIIDNLEISNLRLASLSGTQDFYARNVVFGGTIGGVSSDTDVVSPSSLTLALPPPSSSPTTEQFSSQQLYNLYKKHGMLLKVSNLRISNVVASSAKQTFIRSLSYHPHSDAALSTINDFQTIIFENIIIQSSSVQSATPSAALIDVFAVWMRLPSITAKTLMNNINNTFFETTFRVNNLQVVDIQISETKSKIEFGAFKLELRRHANFANVEITDVKLDKLEVMNVSSDTVVVSAVALSNSGGSIIMLDDAPFTGHWTSYPKFSISKISSKNILVAPNPDSSSWPTSTTEINYKITNVDATLFGITNYNIVEFKEITIMNVTLKQFDLVVSNNNNNNNNNREIFDNPVSNNVATLGNTFISNLALSLVCHSQHPSPANKLHSPYRYEISSLSLSEVYVFGASSLDVSNFMHRRYSALINGFQQVVIDSIAMHDLMLVPYGASRIVNSLSGAASAYRSESVRWRGGEYEIVLSNFDTKNIQVKQNSAGATQSMKMLEVVSTNPVVTHFEKYDNVIIRDFTLENLHFVSADRSNPIRVDGVDLRMLLTANSRLDIRNFKSRNTFVQTDQNATIRLLHINAIDGFKNATIDNLQFNNNTFRARAGSSAKASLLSTSFGNSLSNITISNTAFELPSLPASSNSFAIAFEVIDHSELTSSSSTTPHIMITNNRIIDSSVSSSSSSTSRKADSLATSTSACTPNTCSLLKFAESAFATGTFTLARNTIEPITSMVFVSQDSFVQDAAELKLRDNHVQLQKSDALSTVSAPQLLALSQPQLDLNGLTLGIDCNFWTRPIENDLLKFDALATNVRIRRDCYRTPTVSVEPTSTLEKEPTPTFFNVTNTTAKSISHNDTHSGSLPTRSLSFELPKPKLVADAVSSTVKSLGMALTALSGGANGMNARKVIAISSLADCGKIEITDEDIPPVEPDSNPLFIKFGSKRFDTYRGSIIGAIAFLAAWFVLMCFLGWLRAVIERSSVKRALRKIGVPGTLCVPGFSLLPVAVNSASAIAKRYYPEEKLDMFMIVFAFITAGVIPILILIWIVREVRAHEVLKPSNDISDDDIDTFGEAKEKLSKAEQKKKEKKQIITKLFDDGSEVPAWKYWFDWLTEPKRDFKRSKFRDAYGPIFDGFTTPFFILFSYCLVIAEITEGTTSLCAKGDFECCNVGLNMILAIAVLDVVNIIFFTVTTRAFVFLVRSDAVCVTICALIGLANACIIRVQFDSGEDYTDTLVTLTETAFYIALIGGGLALVNEIVGAGFEVRTVLRQRNKPKEIKEFEELLMSHDVIQKYNGRKEKTEKKKSFSGEKDKNKSSDDSKDKTKKTNAQLQQIVAEAARLDDQELENLLSSPPKRKHGSRDDRNLSSKGRNTTTSRTRHDVDDDIRKHLSAKTKESQKKKSDAAVEDTTTRRRASSRAPRSKPEATSATKREDGHEKKARKVVAKKSDISIFDKQKQKENTTSKKHESSSRTRSATTKKK